MTADVQTFNNTTARGGIWEGVQPYHWIVFFGCWLGGVFDGMDSNLFAVILPNAVTDLAGAEQIAQVGSFVTSVFLVGWMLGGILFGVIGDKLGRVKAMVLSILLYAIFTGLAGLAQTPEQLAICRFLTGLGIGGELVSISTLLSETWPEKSRALAVGALITSYQIGVFLSGFITSFDMEWRTVFFIGALPALLAVFVQTKLHEPEKWQKEKEKMAASDVKPQLPLKELFFAENRKSILIGAGAFGALLIGYWASLAWIPTWIADIQHGEGASNAKSIATMYHGISAVVGCLLAGVFAQSFGRRATIIFSYTGAFVTSAVMFLTITEFSPVVYWMDAAVGFFVGMGQAIMYVYLPELFRTRIRATAVGFCLNSGRLVAAVAAACVSAVVLFFAKPEITSGYAEALTFFAGFYLIAVIAGFFGRETRGDVLPD